MTQATAEAEGLVSATASTRKTVYRSIVISFHDEKMNDFDFLKRLADLRGKYPHWTIRGITHEQPLNFIPNKPQPQQQQQQQSLSGGVERIEQPVGDATLGETRMIAAYLREVQQQKPGNGGASVDIAAGDAGAAPEQKRNKLREELSDSSSLKTASSEGNIIGAKPTKVRVGMRFRKLGAPFAGRTGTVTTVRNSESFQLTFLSSGASATNENGGGEGNEEDSNGDGADESEKQTWWCGRDDVVCVSKYGDGRTRRNKRTGAAVDQAEAAATSPFSPPAATTVTLSTLHELHRVTQQRDVLLKYCKTLPPLERSKLRSTLSLLSDATEHTVQFSEEEAGELLALL